MDDLIALSRFAADNDISIHQTLVKFRHRGSNTGDGWSADLKRRDLFFLNEGGITPFSYYAAPETLLHEIAHLIVAPSWMRNYDELKSETFLLLALEVLIADFLDLSEKTKKRLKEIHGATLLSNTRHPLNDTDIGSVWPEPYESVWWDASISNPRVQEAISIMDDVGYGGIHIPFLTWPKEDFVQERDVFIKDMFSEAETILKVKGKR